GRVLRHAPPVAAGPGQRRRGGGPPGGGVRRRRGAAPPLPPEPGTSSSRPPSSLSSSCSTPHRADASPVKVAVVPLVTSMPVSATTLAAASRRPPGTEASPRQAILGALP